MSTPTNTSTNFTRFVDRSTTNLKGLAPQGDSIKLPSGPDSSKPKTYRFYHHYNEVQNPWIKMVGGDAENNLVMHLGKVFPVLATRQKAVYTIARVKDQQVMNSWEYDESMMKKDYNPKFPVYFWGYGPKDGAYWTKTIVDVRKAIDGAMKAGILLKRDVPDDTPEQDVWPAIIHHAYKSFVKSLPNESKPKTLRHVFRHLLGEPAAWFNFKMLDPAIINDKEVNAVEYDHSHKFALLSRYAENPDYLPVGFTKKDAMKGLPKDIKPGSCYAVSTRSDPDHKRFIDVLVHSDIDSKPYISLSWKEFLKFFDVVWVFDIHLKDKSRIDFKSQKGKYEIWKKSTFKSDVSFWLTAAKKPELEPLKPFHIGLRKKEAVRQTYRITVIPKTISAEAGQVSFAKDGDVIGTPQQMIAGKTLRYLKPLANGEKLWIKPFRVVDGEYLLHIKGDDDTTRFMVETCDPEDMDATYIED